MPLKLLWMPPAIWLLSDTVADVGACCYLCLPSLADLRSLPSLESLYFGVITSHLQTGAYILVPPLLLPFSKTPQNLAKILSYLEVPFTQLQPKVVSSHLWLDTNDPPFHIKIQPCIEAFFLQLVESLILSIALPQTVYLVEQKVLIPIPLARSLDSA